MPCVSRGVKREERYLLRCASINVSRAVTVEVEAGLWGPPVSSVPGWSNLLAEAIRYRVNSTTMYGARPDARRQVHS